MTAPAPPPGPWLPTLEEYKVDHAASLADPDAFWTKKAEFFHWENKPAAAPTASFSVPGVSVSWFKDSTTNICYNAVDRWIETGHGEQVAFYCEGNEVGDTRTVTFAELHDMVQRFANVLLSHGVGSKDVVVLYMPMIPELPAAMLACARIGAMHSVVFAGFSAESLSARIIASGARVVVTAAEVKRARKTIPLKSIMDDALVLCASRGHVVSTQLVATRAGAEVPAMQTGRDVLLSPALASAAAQCAPVWVSGEHPLFVLYTSGSTGAPKGVVHTTGGYMVYAGTTFRYAFDHRAGDVFFSTSDCGWITGHSYVTYGPLLAGATQVLFEGVPNFPDAGRVWEIVARYNVTQLYTAPTALRALKGCSPPGGATSADEWVRRHDTSSLRVLGSVGEPIDEAAWRWYHDVVGGGKARVVDTWWQTETGGHCIVSLPLSGLPEKPGCAMLPFFGVEPAIVSADGAELTGPAEGFLVLKRAWPGMLRTVLNNHARMEETYFARFPGMYMTGDGAKRDADGHYWLTGRVDDVLSVSGHRLGNAEIEEAIAAHSSVTEAAVVGVPHPVKGQGIYAYVSVVPGCAQDDELKKSICAAVRSNIGAIASLDVVHWAPALPKTRSGKIMRRILRKIAENGVQTEIEQLGDVSTLTDPGVVHLLLESVGK